jgi:hypothetical protein
MSLRVILNKVVVGITLKMRTDDGGELTLQKIGMNQYKISCADSVLVHQWERSLDFLGVKTFLAETYPSIREAWMKGGRSR